MTALITGASSGIGKAYAERLARDGHDLILVARREAKLREIASRLTGECPIRAEIIAADLSRRDQVERLAEKIEHLARLDLLINNAGFGTTGLFAESDLSTQIAMLDVHIYATNQLTRAALPGMIARHAGTIINVSSIASFMYGLRRANYCASKAYINVFTKSIQEEVRRYGIKLQALCPGFTYTGFHDTDEFEKFERTSVPRLLWMRAEDVVDISLRALKSRRTVVIPGLPNRLIAGAMQLPPLRWLMVRAMRQRQNGPSDERRA